MDNNDWLSRWENNDIGFHLEQPHPMLLKHWPSTGASASEVVFVPLCGKSHDLYWLQQQGHFVVGAELSEKAVRAFFSEHKLKAIAQPAGEHTYWSTDNDLALIQGDYFQLKPGSLPAKYVYDRAALIALPESLQSHYVQHLLKVSPGIEQILLMTVEYDETITPPPPFSISPERVESLYGNDFAIDLLETRDTKPSPKKQEQGLEVITEHIFKLDRR